jgi:deoxycytidine triphosphate deaminase
MMLTRNEILKEIDNGNIVISDRFGTNRQRHLDNIAECSIDTHLGNVILVARPTQIVDFKKPMEFDEIVLEYGESFRLEPNMFYLMCTKEVIYTTKFALILEEKSSVGRMNVKHTKCGLVEPKFNDVITLEVDVTLPTIVYAGQPFMQFTVNELKGIVSDYDGQYKSDATWRPTPSKIWQKLQNFDF